GAFETIRGVECYVATPTIDYSKDKVLLYITNMFGFAFVNCKVAKTASSMFMNDNERSCPDILQGDPIPADAILGAGGFDLAGWLKTDGAEYARPPLDKTVLAALKRVRQCHHCRGCRAPGAHSGPGRS
ncbi:hypothetical protein C8R44DRAFT_651088, partial [Mycena epipterygia]